MSSCLSSPLRREKLATAIENDNYIKKLLNIFNVCEVGAFLSSPFFFGVDEPSVCCMLEARQTETSQADGSSKRVA